MSLDSRLGGGKPQRWKLIVQPGLVAEAGNWFYSAISEAFFPPGQAVMLEGLQVVFPQGIQIFRVECFGDEGEAQGFVVGELLFYSLTLPLTICLPQKEENK